ncbi:MAG: FAD-dependent oxidoreductase [Chloroflexi bacterium]|nr:MAG: FAD-dependent oxidoreductase [Chloroflexota bacterium]
MKIAIIGGGIAGLTAAYDLARRDSHSIHIYEAGAQVGGLATGFRGRPGWEWPLERFYHHLFTNDDAIIGLTKEIGAGDLLEIHRPTTVMHYRGTNYPFDTPVRLLQFPHLPLPTKLRMGAVLAFLKYWPNPPWHSYDRLLADPWLERWMGKRGYRALWQPMLEGKFGPHFRDVNLAWFWARIYKRTPRLAYYRGGFQGFVDVLAEKVRARGVTIETQTPVQRIAQNPAGGLLVATEKGPAAAYDAILSTVSPGLMGKLTPDLPADYLGRLAALRSMGAVVLTVALDRPLLTDGTYWVNVPKAENLPFLALVEHTNMIDPAHYAEDHLLYLGNYLDSSHPYFSMSKDELLAEFLPALARFNPEFQSEWVTGAWMHREAYAQPVPVQGYADLIPDIRTPLPGLYFASMSQVYPWDRGTNYAVEIGRRVAGMIAEDGGGR